MHDNESHTELQISLLQKCQWTTLYNICCLFITVLSKRTTNLVSTSILHQIVAYYTMEFLKYQKAQLKKHWTERLIENDQFILSTEILQRSQEMEEWVGGPESKMDIRWVIEMESWRDRQVERLGDSSLIGTLIEPRQIPHQHWSIRFRVHWQMVPGAWKGNRTCLINVKNKGYVSGLSRSRAEGLDQTASPLPEFERNWAVATIIRGIKVVRDNHTEMLVPVPVWLMILLRTNPSTKQMWHRHDMKSIACLLQLFKCVLIDHGKWVKRQPVKWMTVL